MNDQQLLPADQTSFALETPNSIASPDKNDITMSQAGDQFLIVLVLFTLFSNTLVPCSVVAHLLAYLLASRRFH
jgi:hypothetical protein